MILIQFDEYDFNKTMKSWFQAISLEVEATLKNTLETFSKLVGMFHLPGLFNKLLLAYFNIEIETKTEKKGKMGVKLAVQPQFGRVQLSSLSSDKSLYSYNQNNTIFHNTAFVVTTHCDLTNMLRMVLQSLN